MKRTMCVIFIWLLHWLIQLTWSRETTGSLCPSEKHSENVFIQNSTFVVCNCPYFHLIYRPLFLQHFLALADFFRGLPDSACGSAQGLLEEATFLGCPTHNFLLPLLINYLVCCLCVIAYHFPPLHGTFNFHSRTCSAYNRPIMHVYSVYKASFTLRAVSAAVVCKLLSISSVWNWPKRTGGSDAEMCEILPRDWSLWPIFTQKWASVDMNWGGHQPPPPDNSNPEY